MISRTSKAQLMALCPGHITQEGALIEALKALWAVQVLDAFADALGWSRVPSPRLFAGKWTILGVGVRLPLCETQAAARIAAAEALTAADPTLQPEGWP